MQNKRRRMKMRLLDVCTVFLVAFLAWFATFVVECYYHGVDSEGKQRHGHVRDHQPPFPGDRNENIFWFLQVRLIDKPHPSSAPPTQLAPLSLSIRFPTSISAMLIIWRWQLILSDSARTLSPSSPLPSC